MIIYLVESTLLLGLLFVLYKLLLENEKMHRFNRFFLLFALAFGLTAPSISFEFQPDQSIAGVRMQQMERVVNAPAVAVSRSVESVIAAEPVASPETEMVAPPVTPAESGWSISNTDMLFGLYGVITLFLFIRFTGGLLNILRKINSGSHEKAGPATLVLLDAPTVPQSFFKFVFLEKKQFESGEIEPEILEHELTHVRRLHSLDVLIIEFLKVIFWFNPFMYLYKHAIQLNHEYIADDSVVGKGSSVSDYQNMLIRVSTGYKPMSATSSISYSLTQKRLLMMVRSYSPFRSGSKTAVILPLLGLLILTFSAQETGYIRILDEIPEDIRQMENLAVFPGDSEPLYSMELIREQTFGETGGPDMDGVGGAAVDDRGRIIISDMPGGQSFPPQSRLHVYNPDGTYHTQITGPDESGTFGYLVGEAAGNVYTIDSFNDRMNVYNTDDYSFERSASMEQWSILEHEAVEGFEFGGLQTRNDGNHLVYFRTANPDSGRSVSKALLVDGNGNALNYRPVVFSSPPDRVDANPPTFLALSFPGGTRTALSDEGAFYTAWSKDFLIHKYDAEGNYQSAIYYPVKGSLVDLDDYTERFRYTREDVENALENGQELPEPTPVLARLMVDDESRIWAAVPLDLQHEMYEWWVLDPAGALLAKLRLPRDQWILEIKNGYLYSAEMTEEPGPIPRARFVARYRIELTS